MKLQLVHTIGAAVLFSLTALAACSDLATGPSDSSGRTSSATSGAMAVSAGSGQSATVGTAVSTNPAVRVTSANGLVASGVTVTFTIAAGGGTLANSTAVTNPSGIAIAGPWVMGSATGENVVVATADGYGTVTFTATATKAVVVVPTSNYNITIRYLATATLRQEQAVTAAVAKWQSVIMQDLVNIPMNAPANSCFEGQPAINESIDDIIIYVEFINIDGAGKVLGEAGPCYVRSGSNLPVVGHLKLDATDLALMERTGTLDDVVLHEMGHILGIGTMWPDNGLLEGAGLPDPRFTGSASVAAYRALGGLDAFVPVENTGGDGTRDGHWRESTFGDELMTGYISGPNNPMSALTIASLTDLGYGTNPGAASNTYAISRTSGVTQGIDLHDHEELVRPKYRVDNFGRNTTIARE